MPRASSQHSREQSIWEIQEGTAVTLFVDDITEIEKTYPGQR